MHKFHLAPAPRGGQYTVSLFGVCLTGHVAAPAPAPLPAPQPRFRRSRIKGALNSFDRDGLTDKHYVSQARPTIPAGQIDLDALERQEWEAEDARARAATTPAMEAAARRAQVREDYEWQVASRTDEERSYDTFIGFWFPHVQAIIEGGAQ